MPLISDNLTFMWRHCNLKRSVASVWSPRLQWMRGEPGVPLPLCFAVPTFLDSESQSLFAPSSPGPVSLGECSQSRCSPNLYGSNISLTPRFSITVTACLLVSKLTKIFSTPRFSQTYFAVYNCLNPYTCHSFIPHCSVSIFPEIYFLHLIIFLYQNFVTCDNIRIKPTQFFNLSNRPTDSFMYLIFSIYRWKFTKHHVWC